MGYDLTIFFDEEGVEDIREIAQIMSNLVGVPMSPSALDPNTYEAHVLALDFGLRKRASYIVDEPDKPFSAFTYQLDIDTHSTGAEIIHPVALMIAEVLSLNFKGRVMVCLSGMEFLGAIFIGGRMTVDHIAQHSSCYAGSRWRYKG